MDSKKVLEKLTRQGLPLDREAMARNKKNNGRSRGNESVPAANAGKTEEVEIAPADDVVSTCSPQTAASAAIETAAGTADGVVGSSIRTDVTSPAIGTGASSKPAIETGIPRVAIETIAGSALGVVPDSTQAVFRSALSMVTDSARTDASIEVGAVGDSNLVIARSAGDAGSTISARSLLSSPRDQSSSKSFSGQSDTSASSSAATNTSFTDHNVSKSIDMLAGSDTTKSMTLSESQMHGIFKALITELEHNRERGARTDKLLEDFQNREIKESEARRKEVQAQMRITREIEKSYDLQKDDSHQLDIVNDRLKELKRQVTQEFDYATNLTNQKLETEFMLLNKNWREEREKEAVILEARLLRQSDLLCEKFKQEREKFEMMLNAEREAFELQRREELEELKEFKKRRVLEIEWINNRVDGIEKSITSIQDDLKFFINETLNLAKKVELMSLKPRAAPSDRDCQSSPGPEHVRMKTCVKKMTMMTVAMMTSMTCLICMTRNSAKNRASPLSHVRQMLARK